MILVGAGSPCQDLSSLKGGRGLDGDKSSLFFEVPRVIELLQDEFGDRTAWAAKNVFSMTAENRKRFSAVLKCQPILVDAKEFGDLRCPRLF